MNRKVALTAMLALAVMAAAPPSAGAHKKTSASIVEIDAYLFSGAFQGTVGSFANKKCSAKRVVAVWKRNPGAMDGPMGTARTGKGGAWTLNVIAPSGSYYATVKPRRLGKKSRKHKHVCKGARSGNFVVP